ncbi:MAG TPA: hypothetical protein VEL82_03260, partial [Thermoplasmata archaeon]|nr:hypothetical protein [Thermoplasmata archaeon]
NPRHPFSQPLPLFWDSIDPDCVTAERWQNIDTSSGRSAGVPGTTQTARSVRAIMGQREHANSALDRDHPKAQLHQLHLGRPFTDPRPCPAALDTGDHPPIAYDARRPSGSVTLQLLGTSVDAALTSKPNVARDGRSRCACSSAIVTPQKVAGD